MTNSTSSSYKIGGYDVNFPFKPYAPQLVLMSKVISTLEKSREKGNSNALLESPTGTGKTLALLCAALTWQKTYMKKKLVKLEQHSEIEALYEGGGFLVGEGPPSKMFPFSKLKEIITIFSLKWALRASL